jgi:hypothetical protein
MVRPRIVFQLAQILLSLPLAFGATYSRTSHIVGSGFYDSFNFESALDPSHGRVNYLDKTAAQSQNITYASSNTFILQTDSTKVLSPWDAGRSSARMVSEKTYTTHVAVFDIAHMPEGCGTWPAIWETSTGPWPDSGEVDIIEGVNNQSPNAMSLHTGANCAVPAARAQTGISTGDNCDVFATGFTGCGVQDTRQNSFGPPFNAAGGGWYALERTNEFFKIWFWPRNDPSVPADVVAGGGTVNTGNWGTPVSYFPNTLCDIPAHFVPHNIVINLTFCGDWAGNAYPGSGCPSTCEDFVNNNPASFKNAYFDIKAVNVYE